MASGCAADREWSDRLAAPIINNLLTAIGRLDRAAERWGRKEGDRLSISWTAVDRLLSRVCALCSQDSRDERRRDVKRAPIMIRRLRTLYLYFSKEEKGKKLRLCSFARYWRKVKRIMIFFETKKQPDIDSSDGDIWIIASRRRATEVRSPGEFRRILGGNDAAGHRERRRVVSERRLYGIADR